MRLALGLSVVGGGAPAFSPQELVNAGVLKAWLESDTGLKQTTGGVTTSNGDPLGWWQDQGADADPLLASTTARPVLRTGAYGAPVIESDATDDKLLGTTNRTFDEVFVLATPVRTPGLHGTSDPVTFDDYRGLVGLNAATTQALIASGDAAAPQSRWLGAFATGYERDGVNIGTAAAEAGESRARHLYAFAQTATYNGAPLTALTERDSAGRRWRGTLTGIWGLRGASSEQRAKLIAWINAKYRRYAVAFDGDSLTDAFGVNDNQSWPSLCYAQYNGCLDCPNVATSGATIGAGGVRSLLSTSGALLDSYLALYVRPVLVIWAGTNDLGTNAYLVNGGSAATALANMTTYIAARRAAVPGLRVIVLNLIDRASDAPSWAVQKPIFNAGLSGVGADVVVDVAGDARLSNHLNATYFNGDGIHLTAAGEAVIWELVQPAIEGQLAA
jgi:lysophospholipase L1-like esterase